MVTDWTRELINRGLSTIDDLLDRNQLSYSQIALCLPTGGMVTMPAIRDGLNERFGGRARQLINGDRIISEGAAWIAHDGLRLGLAKPIELLQSDDTYAAVVPVPFPLPLENEIKSAAKADYHCVDPRLGRASFTFARPRRPRPRDAQTDRQAYKTLHLAVDEMAVPLMERLELNLAIDHDYIAHVDLKSTMRKDHVRAEIFDLEFTLNFPTRNEKSGLGSEENNSEQSSSDLVPAALSGPAGAIRLRANISKLKSWCKVPGDLVIRYRPDWFDDRVREYSEWQFREYVYYRDCPFCHQSRYEYWRDGCGDLGCLWRPVYPTRQTKGSNSAAP
jgi:molecular chaperone DnaK